MQKTQILKRLLHLFRKPLRRRLSQPGEFSCDSLHFPFSFRLFLPLFLQPFLLVQQSFRFFPPLSLIVPDFVDGSAVLILQAVDLVEAVLRILKLFRVEFQIRHIVRHASVEVAKQAVHFGQLAIKILQPFIEGNDSRQLPQCPTYVFSGPVPVRIPGQRIDQIQYLRNSPAVGHPPVIPLQPFVLPFGQSRCPDLIQLELHQRKLPFSGRLVQRILPDFPRHVRMLSPGLFHFLLLQKERFARIAIQNFQMLFRLQQHLAVALSVNIDQNPRQLLQQPGIHSFPVDAADASSGQDLPLQDHMPLFHRNFQFFQFPFRFGRHFEIQFDERGFRAGSDHLPIRFRAQRQRDGAQYDGFSRPGLSGQNVQSGAEHHFRFPDQSQVFHMQAY